jgi:RNA polymerase sigma-70 factor (ECF subfamily)
MQDDAQLARQAAAGDKDAFAALVERHADRVFKTARQWCGSRADAEDITQEVFVKLARKIHSFRGEAQFSTFLYKITVNEARNYYTKEKRRMVRETEFSKDQNTVQDPPADKDSRATDLLRRLPPEQREAVVLVICDGLSHKDAAQALGCAEKTVTWRIFEAKKKLAEWYGHG